MVVKPSQSDSGVILFSTVRHAGSVQHYYHFLLVLLIPLVNFLKNDSGAANGARVIIRSCGPLDRIIRELKFNVEIIKQQEFSVVLERHERDGLRSVVKEGLDFEQMFDRNLFLEAKRFICANLESQIETYFSALPVTDRKVLLVGRGNSDPFYQSDACEFKTSAAQRRSISNYDEIETEFIRKFGNCVSVFLEEMSLAEQIAVFSWADIVVAQHGAALANLVWVQDPAHVIEIAPVELRDRIVGRQEFGRLATCMGLTHEILWQDGLHSRVDVSGLVDCVGGIAPP